MQNCFVYCHHPLMDTDDGESRWLKHFIRIGPLSGNFSASSKKKKRSKKPKTKNDGKRRVGDRKRKKNCLSSQKKSCKEKKKMRKERETKRNDKFKILSFASICSPERDREREREEESSASSGNAWVFARSLSFCLSSFSPLFFCFSRFLSSSSVPLRRKSINSSHSFLCFYRMPK